MGENDIKLDPGQLYFIEPDGSASLLDHVADCSIEPGTDLDDISTPIGNLVPSEFCFEVDAECAFNLFMLMERYRIVNCCPDRRVAHLAMYGKTARVRKKNFNRAIKILEEI